MYNLKIKRFVFVLFNNKINPLSVVLPEWFDFDGSVCGVKRMQLSRRIVCTWTLTPNPSTCTSTWLQKCWINHTFVITQLNTCICGMWGWGRNVCKDYHLYSLHLTLKTFLWFCRTNSYLRCFIWVFISQYTVLFIYFKETMYWINHIVNQNKDV